MKSLNHCENCGLCCRLLDIELCEHDIIREPRLIPHVRLISGGTQGDWYERLEREYRMLAGACVFLDGSCRCSIYPTRPNVCVGFEVGGEQCNRLRSEAGLTPIKTEAAR